MPTVRAISLHQPWASMIAEGKKKIETRRWPTRFRGPILICSTKKPEGQGPTGMALAMAKVSTCRKMKQADVTDTKCEVYHGAYSWVLTNVKALKKPFPVSGKQGLYFLTTDNAEVTSYYEKHKIKNKKKEPKGYYG